MKRMTMLLGAGILFLCSMVFAAVPQLINFQGILRDGSGNPVADGSYLIIFTIYDAPTGGNVQWAESQSVPTLGGQFSVYLGRISPIPNAVFSGPDRWLGVRVSSDPEMTPRQRLASVGYSYRVNSIDGASGGMIAGDLSLSAGNINLDTSSATGGNIYKGGSRFIHNFGTYNTFIGIDAGNLTMTGGGNTASGYGALTNNTTGVTNTASGYQALRGNTSGNDNTANGVWALVSNSGGYANTACGVDALFDNQTGAENTANGAAALFSNTTGIYNTASGFSALYNNTTASKNTANGHSALITNKTGSNNTALGYQADVSVDNLTNATAIGSGAVVDASNKIRLGNGAVTVIEGQVAYTFTSDKNQKENFRPVNGEEIVQKIRGLPLSSWNYKGHDPKQFRHYGPMAQDFFAAFGDDGVGKIGTETTLNSGDVAGILMVAVQALGNENAELKTRIEQLEKQVIKLGAEKPQAEVR